MTATDLTEVTDLQGGCEEYEFPLSFQQTRLWILEQLDPGNPAYHVPITLRITGALRVPVLHAAFQLIVDRHEVLRTRFEPDSQVQLVAESCAVSPTLVDLSGLDEPHREPALARVKRDAARRAFDLSASPLRIVLIRTGHHEHVLVVVVHHIACDGWSVGVLAGELSAAYSALCAGRAPELPELPVQYGDFSLWQQERLSGAALRDELDHWSGVLAGAPLVLALPTDRPRPAEPSNDGDRVRRTVGEPLVVGLERLARAHGVSMFMVLLAAYGAVLGRLSRQDSVLVGTATAGRSRPEIGPLVGCFIDVVPLRVDVSGDPSIAEFLARVRGVCVDAFAHQDLPFERLVEHLQPARDLAYTPVFQVMLNLHDTPRAQLQWPGLQVVGEEPQPGVAKYDLTLDVHRDDSGLILDIEFNRDVFEPDTVSRLLERIESVLAWFGRMPGTTSMSDVDIVAAAELAWLRAVGSGTRAPGAEGSLADLAPDGPAHHLARALSARGVRRGDAVGVMLPPSKRLTPVLFGVWLAGAVCVPLDPELPLRRLGFVVADSRMRVVVSCAELADRIPGSGVSVVLVEGVPAGDVVARPDLGRADPALVTYSGGSAGRPTGLMVSHGAVMNLLSSRPTGPELGAADPSAALTELATGPQTRTWFGLATVDGSPVANTELFVLDRRLRPVPAGVTGELFVSGAGMPDGYLGRPGLTAERFLPSPFGGGERMYRTGELARFRPDGRLLLAGPVEGQVTVRGCRLQLGEIENRLATHPAVAQVAVAVHDDGLVAYLRTRPDVPVPTTGELREQLRDVMPGYLLRTTVIVDAIPRTRDGQIDRDALPAPDGLPRQARPVAPRDAVESLVLDCFRRVLDRPGLGVTDDFFDHGGSSMAAMRLLAELEQATGHRLVLRELFRETTPEAVATRLRSEADGPVGQPVPAELALPGDLSCAPVHPNAWSPGHVLLTGVGDLLGVALLERLLTDRQVVVTCLVQAGDDEEARTRLHRAAGEFEVDLRRFGDRLRAIAADVGAERLGLPEPRYAALAGEVAAIYHRPSDIAVRGTQQVIRFAAAGAGKVVHLLQPLSERDGGQRLDEELAYQAACRGVPVTITRGGPASAHQSTGASDPSEPLTRCLTAALRFGLLPDLPDLPLQIMPVDQVADAIVRAGRCPAADGQVIELVNARRVTVSQLAAVLAELGRPVRLVPFDALSPEQARLLAVLSTREQTSVRPAIDADRAALVLGQPLQFSDLTAGYVRRAIGYLTTNRNVEGRHDRAT